MLQPIHSFVFRCSGCGKVYSISEEYDEHKEYTCPGCNIVSVIKRKDVKYTAKAHPFTFQCPHCHEVQRTYDYEFQRDVDGFDITTCNCPGCGKPFVYKYEQPYHYFARKEGAIK